MGRIGLCVFCLLKFSVAMCILLVKKLEKGNITTKSGSLRNSMQKCGKILRGERPRRSDASVAASMQRT